MSNLSKERLEQFYIQALQEEDDLVIELIDEILILRKANSILSSKLQKVKTEFLTVRKVWEQKYRYWKDRYKKKEKEANV